jgi:hypothetical protein
MNHGAESSRAGQRRRSSSSSSMAGTHAANDDAGIADSDREHGTDGARDAHDAHDTALREQRVKERRLDAKRKRVVFLDHLLRELDTLVFLELIALYHLEYICRDLLPAFEC